jgi:hypothetical protein
LFIARGNTKEVLYERTTIGIVKILQLQQGQGKVVPAKGRLTIEIFMKSI